MKIKMSDINAKAKIRGEDYKTRVLSLGHVVGNELLIDDVRGYMKMYQEFNPAVAPTKKSCCGNAHMIKPPPSPQLKMPSLPTQVKNATGAAARVVKNLVRGRTVKATDEVVAERKAICDSCEFLDKERNRCSKCGCWYKIKIGLASESCPINKWNKVDVLLN